MTKPVLVLEENTKGRDFVVGDIHGIFDVLDEALKEVKFDPAVDRLIAVGDLIDRGPQSAKCLEYLKQPWFFAIKGNHEGMFLYFYKDGLKEAFKSVANTTNGMGWILKEEKAVLDELKTALEKLPIAIELRTKDGIYGFVHAEVPLGMSWPTFTKLLEDGDKKTEKIALWSRKRVEEEIDIGVEGVLRVYSGHTPVKDNVKQLGNCFYMDTGGVFHVLYGSIAEKFFLTVAEVTAKAEDIVAARDNTKKLFKTIENNHQPPKA